MTLMLVTGAGGFVGSLLVAELRRRSVAVRATVRNSGPVQSFDSGVDVRVTGDLAAHQDLDGLLEGVDTVMHLAARAHVTSDQGERNAGLYRIVNEELTRRLAVAAVRSGVRRFVFVSSIKVFGEFDQGRPFRATDPPMPLDVYGQSKWRAEQALWDVCKDTGMTAAVIRPPLVYGPGVRANFLRLMQLVERGIPLPLAAVDNRRSLVSADNLVDLLCVCGEHAAAAGRTWLVSDGADLSTPQLLSKVAHAMGRRPRLFSVPVPVLRRLAAVAGYAGEISRLTDSLSLDIDETRSLLGWHPVRSIDEAIARTVDNYQGSTR